MPTRQRVTSHAADLSTHQAEEPKASLGQLRKLQDVVIDRMRAGEMTRTRMNNLIRLAGTKTVSPFRGPKFDPQPGNELLKRVEAAAIEHFPDHVEQILELIGPICDPNLSLELAPYVPSEDTPANTALRTQEALKDWLPEAKYRIHELPYDRNAIMQVMSGPMIFSLVEHRMFRDVRTTLSHTVVGLSEGVWAVCNEIYAHLERRLVHSFAVRYRVIDEFHWDNYLGGIHEAMKVAVTFAVRDDLKRLEVARKFLQFQISGTPLVRYDDQNDIAHIIAAPSKHRR